MSDEKKTRQPIDWEAVEREYRVGIKTLRQIADEHGCSHTAIKKRAEREGWSRDIHSRIQAKADELVSRSQVSKEVSMETKATERQVVDANARVIADVVISQQTDLIESREIERALVAELAGMGSMRDELEKIGEMLRSPDELGNEKLNDLYRAAISHPQRVKSAKLLMDMRKARIETERKVLRIDTMPDDPVGAAAKGAAEGAAAGVSQSTRSMLSELMGELGTDETPAAG